MGGSAWGLWQQQQPPPVQRHTYSAPGSSSAGRASEPQAYEPRTSDCFLHH
jgi:hypothetical protein